jgi:flagellar biosynthesis/type III secretory pathway M-ring protein FliF/YscJ
MERCSLPRFTVGFPGAGFSLMFYFCLFLLFVFVSPPLKQAPEQAEQAEDDEEEDEEDEERDDDEDDVEGDGHQTRP